MALVLAIIALTYCVILGRKAKNSRIAVEELKTEVKQLSQQLAALKTDAPTLSNSSQQQDTSAEDGFASNSVVQDGSIAQVEPVANSETDTAIADKATDSRWDSVQPSENAPPTPSGPTLFERAFKSFTENWLIWISALSLSMGGLFFIRYGIEKGILGPRARVGAAVGFGFILISAAEYFRRKKTIGMSGWFSIPGIFATGGLASLFGAAVGAHLLYDLVGTNAAFICMALLSLLAVGLGIIYGPVLAVLGILGAFAAPIIVSTGSGAPAVLYGYYLLVLASALWVERYMRWIWLSAFGVALAIANGLLLLSTDLANGPYNALYAAAIILMASCIPAFGWKPRTDNKVLAISGISDIPNHYPTVLSVVTAIAGTLLILFGAPYSVIAEQSGIIVLITLLLWAIFWLDKAENMDELSPIFVIGVLGICAFTTHHMTSDAKQIDHFKIETTALLAISAIAFYASFWRGARSSRPLSWIAGGTVVPILAFALHYIDWHIGQDLFSERTWAMWAIALVAMLGIAATLMLRSSFELSRTGADIYAVGGLITSGFAAYFLIPKDFHSHISGLLALVALTLVIRFNFTLTKHMIWAFVTAASALALWRLFPDLMSQHLFNWLNLASFTAVIVPFIYGYSSASKEQLNPIAVLFETATFVIGTAALIIVLRHMFAQTDGIQYMEFGLYAALASVMAGVQLRRAKVAQNMQSVRTNLAGMYIAGAVMAYLLAILTSPLWFAGQRAYGVPPISTVFIAYLFAPALLAFAVWKTDLVKLVGGTIKFMYFGATAIGAFVLSQEVRHFWHGSTISIFEGVITGELYTYTILLLLLTIGFVILSLRRQDQTIKHYALVCAGLTAIKVFTFDMSGMTGLTRATAFILLGLSLAGIGWLLQAVRENNEESDSPRPNEIT